jgi:hypothetical protein
LRSYRHKFHRTHGELVIACDSRNSWRKTHFPYYKAKRKIARDQSEIDWNHVFYLFDQMKSELKQFFPYCVIEVDGAEADDVIAALVMRSKLNTPTLILSGDKDFIQLHHYPNVTQYDPVLQRTISSDDPKQYLYLHILKGDSGDGIPNVLSDDDTFVVPDKRQNKLTQKRIDAITAGDRSKFANFDRNLARNTQLIDLTIPVDLHDRIILEYQQQSINRTRKHLLNYFIQHGLKNLMENLDQF